MQDDRLTAGLRQCKPRKLTFGGEGDGQPTYRQKQALKLSGMDRDGLAPTHQQLLLLMALVGADSAAVNAEHTS